MPFGNWNVLNALCRSISALKKHIELLHPLERVPSACAAAEIDADTDDETIRDGDCDECANDDEPEPADGRTRAGQSSGARSRVLASLGLDEPASTNPPAPPMDLSAIAAAARRSRSIDEEADEPFAAANAGAPRRVSRCSPAPVLERDDADADDEDEGVVVKHEMKQQQLTCSAPGCGRVFTTECGLRAHMQFLHEGASHSNVRHRSEAAGSPCRSLEPQHALLASDAARVALAPVFSFATHAAPLLHLPSSVLLSAPSAGDAPQEASQQQQQPPQMSSAALLEKRSRTRITEEHLRVLRAHFNLNCSPSDEEMSEMSARTGLPVKVIKHWFRNTLFKERQRSKDSPYNFSIPPVTSLNLEEYARTGIHI